MRVSDVSVCVFLCLIMCVLDVFSLMRCFHVFSFALRYLLCVCPMFLFLVFASFMCLLYLCSAFVF